MHIFLKNNSIAIHNVTYINARFNKNIFLVFKLLKTNNNNNSNNNNNNT
jgi:hypothetical protein